MFWLLRPHRGAPQRGRSRTLALVSLENLLHQNLSLLPHGLNTVDLAEAGPDVNGPVTIAIEEAYHKSLFRITLFPRFQHCHFVSPNRCKN